MLLRNLRPALLIFLLLPAIIGCKKDTTPGAPSDACYKIYRIVTKPVSKAYTDYRSVTFGSEGDLAANDTVLMTFTNTEGIFSNPSLQFGGTAQYYQLQDKTKALVINVSGQQYITQKPNAYCNLVFVDCGNGDYARVVTGIEPPENVVLLKHNRTAYINPSRKWFIFSYNPPYDFSKDTYTYKCAYETYNADGDISSNVIRKEFDLTFKKP